MTFNSLEFGVFFSLILALRVWVGRTKQEHMYLMSLLLGSLLFYAWNIPWYLLLMLATAIVHYLAGKYIARVDVERTRRKLVAALAIAASLTLLAIFKYTNFLVGSMLSTLGSFGLPANWTPVGIVLPIGISFYTFHALSYTIDVYRRKAPPAESFWQFLLYIAFFPQLVAGPIVRARDFLYQINRKRSITSRVLLGGAYLCVRGFFFKLVVADNIAAVVNQQWKQMSLQSTPPQVVLFVIVLFSAQIFADFSGYTDIARGVAYLLGFQLPLNFNYPYIASSFSNFWRRWHISLSSWLRDYLYIPLGGNRVSRGRTSANILTVMLLGGLWHGAAYTFIIWGGLHGIALLVERLLGRLRTPRRLPRFAWWLTVQAVVLVAWTFFRAESVNEATTILGHLASWSYAWELPVELRTGTLFVLPVVAVHARAFLTEQRLFPRAGALERGIWSGGMFFLTLTCYGQALSPFIYFQF